MHWRSLRRRRLPCTWQRRRGGRRLRRWCRGQRMRSGVSRMLPALGNRWRPRRSRGQRMRSGVSRMLDEICAACAAKSVPAAGCGCWMMMTEVLGITPEFFKYIHIYIYMYTLTPLCVHIYIYIYFFTFPDICLKNKCNLLCTQEFSTK